MAGLSLREAARRAAERVRQNEMEDAQAAAAAKAKAAPKAPPKKKRSTLEWLFGGGAAGNTQRKVDRMVP